MALVKCRECGKEIGSEAKICPGCGTVPKRTSGCAMAFLVFAVIGVGGAILGTLFDSHDSVQKAPVPLTPEQIAAAQAKKEVSDFHSAQIDCENAVKKSLHDPDSAQFDNFEQYALLPGSKLPNRYVILVTLRAKNGFGGLRHIAVTCTLTRKNPADGWTYSLKEHS
jgi:hypothetical protein